MKHKLLKLSKMILVFILTISLLFTGSYVNADNEKIISSWLWSDGNESIQYTDNKWQTNKELTQLPSSILAIVDNKQETVSVSWNEAEDTYLATLQDGYVLDDETNTITVYTANAVQTEDTNEVDTQADTNTDTSYLDNHIKDAVSPEGTNINLFDYWITPNRFDSDRTSEPYGNGVTKVDGKSIDYLNTGINETEYDGTTSTVIDGNGKSNTEDNVTRGALKFSRGGDTFDLQKSGLSAQDKTQLTKLYAGKYYNQAQKNNKKNDQILPLVFATSINEDTFSSVYRNLYNGYPKLSVTHLTDKTYSNHWPSNETSLDYLFNPKTEVNGKASFSNVKGLLQTSTDGYYYYDSQQNFAEFDENTNKFKLYDTGGVAARTNTTDSDGQFFPFNKGSEVFSGEDANGLVLNRNSVCDDAKMNHYFGLTLTSRFIQQNGGRTRKNKPVQFEFSGDDDVWVFIDDVLVADLGGMHSKASLDIDFSTGDVTLTALAGMNEAKTKKTTIKNQFKLATEEDKSDFDETKFSGNTFADNTYHTLKFYYLERGNYVSNLELKYNLVTVPESSIKKLDQNGKALEGATFALYEADENYKVKDNTKPLCTGTTDPNGEYILRDKDDQLISLDQLKQQGKEYFVLQETTVPSGYRKIGDEIHLQLKSTGNNTNVKGAYFRTANKAESGVKARSNGTITVTDSFNYYSSFTDGKADPTTVDDYDSNKGLVVAVPIKYVSSEPKTISNLKNIYYWAPVTGNSIDGYEVKERGENEDPLICMLKEAQEENIATLSTDGSYKMKINDLPGLIEDYYQYQLGQLDNQTDTTRVLNDVYFSIAYIYIAHASKLSDATVEGVNKNTFFIETDNKFEREYSTTITVFNKQNNVKIQKLDTLGNVINKPATFALYNESDVENGKVKDGANPVRENIVTKEDGTVDVNDLDLGTYYLKETVAPAGYELTDQLVRIVVNDENVYVDAGKKDDDVDVVLQVGHAVKTYYHYVNGELDLLMRDIKATLKTGAEVNNLTKTSKVGYFSYNMEALVNESQYDFVKQGDSIGSDNETDTSQSTINNADELCYDEGFGALDMNLWYKPDSSKKLAASKIGTDGENTSLNNLFNNVSVIRIRNKKKETYYLQKDKAANIQELDGVDYTPEDEKIKFSNNEWTASETGTYNVTVKREGESVAVTFYVYDAKDKLYVLDYGLKAKLADATQGKDLKDGIFGEDTLSIDNNETSNKVTSIGNASNATSVAGENGTLTIDELNKPAENTTITYEPTKFMDSEDEFKVTTQVQSGTDTFKDHYNGIEMTKNVTVLPASVVYYEDNFAGSSTTENNDNKPIVYKNATSGGTTVTTNDISIDNQWQSIDQEENYGYDSAYNTTAGDANGSTKLDKLCSMSFTFKGKGFDLVGRSSKDSGRILVTVKKDNTVVKSQIRDLSYEDDVTNSALYRLPLVSCQGLDYGEYQVTVVVMTSTSEAKGTALYVDGIRIYHPLDNETNYMSSEQSTTTDKVRDLILGGETELNADNAKIAVVNYDEKGNHSTLGGTITEDRGFVPSETNDLERYLNVGPKEEVYIRKNSGIAFRVKPADGKTKDDITLQVEAKLVNTQGHKGTGTLTNASVTAKNNINIESTSGMYYKILLGDPKEDGSYLVVLANTSDADISLTNLKYKNCTIEMPKAGDDLVKTNVVVPEGKDTTDVKEAYNNLITNTKNESYTVSSVSMNQNYMTSGTAGYINVTYKVKKSDAVQKSGATGETIKDYEPPVPELYSYDNGNLTKVELTNNKEDGNSYWQVGAQQKVETENTTTTNEKVTYFLYTYRIKVTPTEAKDKQLYAVGANVKNQSIKEPEVIGTKINAGTSANVSVENKETEAIVTLNLTKGIKIVDEEEDEWNQVNDVKYEKTVKENGKYQVHVEDEEAIKGIEDPISQVIALDYEVQLKKKEENNKDNNQGQDNKKDDTVEDKKDENVEVSTKDIEMIEGQGSVWKDRNSGLTFRSNAEYKDFVKVLVDGKEVNKKYYTVRSGSTIVELHKDYLSTLSNGKHTIEIVSTTGTAKATFMVENNGSIVYTGDDNRVIFLVSLLLLSCIGFVFYQRNKARD